MIYTTIEILEEVEYSDCTYRDRGFIKDNYPRFNPETDDLVHCRLGLKQISAIKDVMVPTALLKGKYESSFITPAVRVLSALVVPGCPLSSYSPVTLRCRLLNTLDDM